MARYIFTRKDVPGHRLADLRTLLTIIESTSNMPQLIQSCSSMKYSAPDFSVFSQKGTLQKSVEGVISKYTEREESTSRTNERPFSSNTSSLLMFPSNPPPVPSNVQKSKEKHSAISAYKINS